MASLILRNPPPIHSLIEYFYPPESEGHRCGYCKSKDTNFANGIWAHTLSTENYENLINIGWRRSGCYVYKPMNEKICCPMYTIRNLSTKVEITRSQRKVLKRFKKYIKDDIVPKKGVGENDRTKGNDATDSEERINDCPIEIDSEISSKEDVELECIDEAGNQRDVVCGGNKSADQSAKSPTSINCPENKANSPATDSQSLSTEKKSHPLKRKFLRRERKRQKLIAKGLDPEEFFKRNERNRVKELEDFFKDEPSSKHRFTTKLVRVDSVEFTDEIFDLEHALYQKYQMRIHGDSDHDCRASQFKRFLCENPFGDDSPQVPSPQGLFHQHYCIDSRLIAVGVIDILPHCVSSVYFFYDPDFGFLSPGTLSALQEIHFVNELHKTNPRLQYYYLGFYIHTCVKMRYKRKFRPCELLCPVSRNWVKFDDRVLNLLDNQKFSQLYEGNDFVRRDQEDINRILLLYKRRIHPYPTYPNKLEQAEELQSYVNLVSADIASNMLLYRSSGP